MQKGPCPTEFFILKLIVLNSKHNLKVEVEISILNMIFTKYIIIFLPNTYLYLNYYQLKNMNLNF